ncbi:TonB-dependent receptor plug domain-containing protein [Flavobacterium facile]|uniref:TonB-dependent receptor plug domain-containing protein n=1 Tax=Flavobacterium facile TaxID=2893174 RepID=UPI002E7A55AF|nr:TonB-dependent receptor [Flavobacterium sp. T-12]
MKNIRYILFLLAFKSFSQNEKKDTIKSVLIEEVVVTATRTERQLSSLPLPVQLITKAQIKQTGALKLNDILEEQTGLIIVPDFGGVLGIQMQGLDAQYTLILIDGVPLVGRSAGSLDLSRVAVNNIKQIEIVKGASSSLYGSEALGGVINIITESPKNKKITGELNSRIGTFFTTDNNLNFGFGINKLNINASINSFSTDGYDLDKKDNEKTVLPYRNLTSQLQLDYRFSDKSNLVVSNRYFNQSNNVETIVNNKNASGITKTNEYNSHSRFFYNPNDNLSFTGEFYATQYYIKDEVRFNDTNATLYNDFFKENLLRPEIRTSYKKRNTTYTSGFGYNLNNLERTYFDQKALNNSYYGFLQYDYNLKEKFNILAGLRYDKNLAYASVLSPKLALNYQFSKQFSIQGSVGYGFKAPDLRQLFFNFENVGVGYIVLGYNVAPNRLAELESQRRIQNSMVSPNFFDNPLNPETSVGYNFGIKHNREKIKTSINIFYNEVKNLIDTRAIAQLTNGQNIFSYTNIGSVSTQGLELNSLVKITKNIEISGGYQYLIAKDNDVIQDIKDKKVFAREPITSQSFELKQSDYFGLFNRSKHTANFKYFLKIPNWKLYHNIRATYRSKYGLFDTNNNAILDNYDAFAKEYVIFDTSITKKIKKKFEVQIGIDNILNFTDTQNASNYAGRVTYCKVQYHF